MIWYRQSKHHRGFFSHNPDKARRLLDTGLVDMMMFSINPTYDYQSGDYAIGKVAERVRLYREYEQMGVGISVMKPFAEVRKEDVIIHL